MGKFDSGDKRFVRPKDAKELSAVAFSGGIIFVAIVYWAIQIKGVMELLELAYG